MDLAEVFRVLDRKDTLLVGGMEVQDVGIEWLRFLGLERWGRLLGDYGERVGWESETFEFKDPYVLSAIGICRCSSEMESFMMRQHGGTTQSDVQWTSRLVLAQGMRLVQQKLLQAKGKSVTAAMARECSQVTLEDVQGFFTGQGNGKDWQEIRRRSAPQNQKRKPVQRKGIAERTLEQEASDSDSSGSEKHSTSDSTKLLTNGNRSEQTGRGRRNSADSESESLHERTRVKADAKSQGSGNSKGGRRRVRASQYGWGTPPEK